MEVYSVYEPPDYGTERYAVVEHTHATACETSLFWL